MPVADCDGAKEENYYAPSYSFCRRNVHLKSDNLSVAELDTPSPRPERTSRMTATPPRSREQTESQDTSAFADLNSASNQPPIRLLTGRTLLPSRRQLPVFHARHPRIRRPVSRFVQRPLPAIEIQNSIFRCNSHEWFLSGPSK
jgi:hypothetical protein